VLIENCWAEEINGVRVGVRAGALLTDIEQGALQLQDEVYLTPSRSGTARIVQADALFLTVRTANGDFFGFDVRTGQWDTARPTATPKSVDAYSRGIQPCETPPSYFLAGNCWAEILNGSYYQVRAGAARPEPAQGYINVRRQSLESGSSPWEEEYLTPTEAGRIEVVAANDFVLTLRAENGSLFAFDLDSRTWITPPATATPVPATPTSTTTPSPTPAKRVRAATLLAGIPADPAARAQTRELATRLAALL